MKDHWIRIIDNAGHKVSPWLLVMWEIDGVIAACSVGPTRRRLYRIPIKSADTSIEVLRPATAKEIEMAERLPLVDDVLQPEAAATRTHTTH